MNTKLSVNLNKVALVRNSRHGNVPSVVKAARLCLDAGAHGITVHPRPDERHIRPGDVDDLKQVLAEPGYAHAEYNIEGNPFAPSFMDLVTRVRPHQCTLVPDSPEQFTSDHGWDIAQDGARLVPIVTHLQSIGCRVSLFMDPDPDRIALVPSTGADRVELYTESYAVAYAKGGAELEASWETFRRAAAKAQELGLGVNAGHDLNLDNLSKFASIPNILEVSIGHALIADALERGLPATVKAYLDQLKA